MTASPRSDKLYLMNLRAKRHTKPIEKMITPTITMFEMLAVMTPTIFSFIVSTTPAVVEATSASTAAKALAPAKSPPATAKPNAMTLALVPVKKLLIFAIIVLGLKFLNE